jgi:hypothetical protein
MVGSECPRVRGGAEPVEQPGVRAARRRRKGEGGQQGEKSHRPLDGVSARVFDGGGCRAIVLARCSAAGAA